MASNPPSAATTTRDWRDPATILAAVALLALFWWLAVSASTHWSPTSDELPHLAAGYAYDKFNDFRMQPENGILPQRLHGLVPLVMHARFPTTEANWQHSQVWQLGWDFFYGLDNPTDQIVLGARALNALFGVGLGCFIFCVARRWYGATGGLVALGLFAFCPNFLFHSAQATSDLAGVLFLTVTAWVFWWHLQHRTVGSGLLGGLLSGLALTAKFSGLLLLPIYAALVLGDVWLRAPAGRRWRRVGTNLLHGLGVAGVAFVVIWGFYDFRFSARAPGTPALVEFFWPWRPELALAGWKGAVIARALSWHVLPEAYLRGLDYVFASEVERPSFLAGSYSLHGSRLFFPMLFLVKTPLAVLLGSVLASGLALVRFRNEDRNGRREALARWLPLGLVALVTWVAGINSSLNIGHRHILAVYPPLFIAIGGLAASPWRWRAVPLLLCALQATESSAIRPHYLAYFNPFGGGPAQAYRIVADSSLDWGQDLPALRAWLQANRRTGERFFLSYFGSAWPPYYGVRPTHFLPAINLARPPFKPYDLDPGLYAISATSLSEVYSNWSGPWRKAWEDRLRAMPPDSEDFDQLRFARLCKYLQHRVPDANAGYSILIYRLTAADLDAALNGPVKGW